MIASIAYRGPLGAGDPAKTRPLTTETGPDAISLLGFAVDQSIVPVFASSATHAPAVVVWVEGARVNLARLLLAMLV